MRFLGIVLLLGCVVLEATVADAVADAIDYRELAKPVVEGRWLRPVGGEPGVPRWGHAKGLQVGLSPLPGPRGLLRIYTPYLGQPETVMINFIAVEPIPAGQEERGLSELEWSKLDGERGKRFWSEDELADVTPRSEVEPARGRIEMVDGVECLRVFVLAERFDNGAHVAVRLTFREDRPHEVGVATFTHDDSVELSHCIVTATMGNYARLRQLHLDNRIVTAQELWPDYQGDGFAPHARFPLDQLSRTADGGAIVAATSDEAQPQRAEYARGTNRHWRYQGQPARQSWRTAAPHPQLEAVVNARQVYWGSRSPIPDGTSFENFELAEPFQQGAEFWFAVEPLIETAGN